MNLKKTILLIVAVGVIGAIILFVSTKKEKPQVCGVQNQVETVIKSDSTLIADTLDMKYNYAKNEEPFDMTFLEFGSTGCKPCQMMEQVMEQVKAKYPRVNVRFINVAKKETKEMSDYFNINQIPTQVLLDKNGKEYFRHVGYFSLEDLNENFK